MTPEIAEKAAELFNKYKECGGKVDHIEYISDPVEAAKVRETVVAPPDKEA